MCNGIEYRLERSFYQLIWLELELEIEFCRYEVLKLVLKRSFNHKGMNILMI